MKDEFSCICETLKEEIWGKQANIVMLLKNLHLGIWAAEVRRVWRSLLSRMGQIWSYLLSQVAIRAECLGICAAA